MKPQVTTPSKGKTRRTVFVLQAYRDLKTLCRQTNLFHPLDFKNYLEARLRKLQPRTVLAIAKYHGMKRLTSDPESVSLWLAETIFEKTAWQ